MKTTTTGTTVHGYNFTATDGRGVEWDTVKFVTGHTYMTRSVCDWNCKVVVTIAKRTAKYVTTTEGKRLGVRNWDITNRVGEVIGQAEHIKPWGSYSMAPSIGADQRVAKPKGTWT